jgi:hypothetical protein
MCGHRILSSSHLVVHALGLHWNHLLALPVSRFPTSGVSLHRYPRPHLPPGGVLGRWRGRRWQCARLASICRGILPLPQWRHCLASSLGATFGDGVATHGSLASALFTHCSSGIACSCAHPCGSLLSPQACLISSLPPITYAWQLSSSASMNILEVCPLIQLRRVLGSVRLGRSVTEGPFP